MRVSRRIVRRNLACRFALVLVGAGLLLSGCVSIKRTPGARFFVLRSLVEAKASPESIEGAIGLLPVCVPGALDRPQLVTWAAPNELRLDELQRWAEPLAEGVTRTLAENLSALLPRDRILRTPWPAAASPRCRVAVELRVFGPQPNGEVRLEASFDLLAPKEERVLVRRTLRSSQKPAAAGTGASVDAMSTLVADLAGQIAEAVDDQSIESAQGPVCP